MTLNTPERTPPPFRALIGFLALLAAFLALPLFLAPRADAFIYWTRGDGISRANLDGTAVNENFITGERATPRDFESLAVDDAHVYWTSWAEEGGGTGRIGRADLDGTRVDERFITGTGGAESVAVDGAHVYWTHIECPPDSTGVAQCAGAIGRANLDGSGVDASLIDGITPSSVAVDASHIYWTNGGYGSSGVSYTIGRAELDGTDIEQDFISAPSEDSSLGDLAVDASHIYYVTGQTGQAEGPRGIARADLDGMNIDESFIPIAPPAPFLGNVVESVAVDAAHVYWTQWNWPADLHAKYVIGRANLDGSGAETFIAPRAAVAFDIAVDSLTDTTAPKTKITKGAPKQTKKARIKFRFRSSEPNSSFECKQDRKPWKRCTSPTKLRHLDEGKHRFKVRATDAACNADPTPAKDKFKVVG